MIVKDEFLSKLRRYFSLNLYEVKIWTALLSRGVSTAGELSDIDEDWKANKVYCSSASRSS
jgi:sugar-specific transcriptional regulator TrmB